MVLKGKTAVVTGADGGLGSAIVQELDKEGVKCILISRNEEKLKNLISGLSNLGHSWFVTDYKDIAKTQQVIKDVQASAETVDILVNAMGIGIYKGIEDVTLEEWNDSLTVNLTAPFLVIKYILPSLRKSQNPVVVNIGSGVGKDIYHTDRIAYCASKFGLRGMTLELSKDFEDEEIKFCHIALGSMLTNFGPGGLQERLKNQNEGKKYFTPEWVAKKLLELLKEDKLTGEITLYPSDYI